MSSEVPPASTGEAPTLFVCHGDDGGPRMHPCRRVQEALRDTFPTTTPSAPS
jgi:hypothetical protein